MAINNKPWGRGDPDRRRQPRNSGPSRQTSTAMRPGASDEGRSGYGSESVRPYLRAQLRLRELLVAAPAPMDSFGADKPGRRKGRSER